MTIDEMQQALIEAGYGFNFNDMDYSAYWHSPDGGSFQVLLSDINPQSGQADLNAHKVISKSIEKAYAHLLQSRRMIAMEAFLHKLLAFEYNYQGTDMQIWQKEAKEILGVE